MSLNLEHIMGEARSLLSPPPHNYYTTARSKSNCSDGKTPEPPVCRSGGTPAVDTPFLCQATEEGMVLSKAVTLPQLPTGTPGIPGTGRQTASLTSAWLQDPRQKFSVGSTASSSCLLVCNYLLMYTIATYISVLNCSPNGE